MVEHLICNQGVAGSIPAAGTSFPSPLSLKGDAMLSERVKEKLFLGLGLFFVGLGFLGLFLPVLPSVVFMIVALGCFARSSEKLHHWLYTHRLFSRPLKAWGEYRVIPPVAKFSSIAAMGGSMIYLSFFTQTAPLFLIAAGAIILFGAGFILSKPSHPPKKQP